MGASILNLGPLSRDLISSPVPAKSALSHVAARVGSRSVQSRTCVFREISPAPSSGSRDRVCILVVRGGSWWLLVSKFGESESESLSPFPAVGHPGHRNSDAALEKSKTGKKALSLGGRSSKKSRVSSSGSCPLQRSSALSIGWCGELGKARELRCSSRTCAEATSRPVAPAPVTTHLGLSPFPSLAGGLISTSSGTGRPLAPRISFPRRHGPRSAPMLSEHQPREIRVVPAK